MFAMFHLTGMLARQTSKYLLQLFHDHESELKDKDGTKVQFGQSKVSV